MAATGEDRRSTLLDRIVADPSRPFAMVQRQGGDGIDLMVGEFAELGELAEVSTAAEHSDLLVLVPYRQTVERGFPCNDDGVPLLAMSVVEHEVVDLAQVLDAIGPGLIGPNSIAAADFRFDVSDDEYCDIVRSVIANEIGTGEGSNFVISRSLTGSFGADYLRVLLGLFRRLLSGERGAYWTYLVHTGNRTFVGASPEAHAHLDDSIVSMNPISGTYRYPPDGATESGLLAFLADQKENDELFMVVDEELKMMSALCSAGATVTGPYLKEMAHLAHTEYLLRGQTEFGVAEVLRETMFAPTVVGSPLESAAQVVARYETVGRGYYSGAIAFIDRGRGGSVRMDSAILIRTAVVDADGNARITVGSTLVRDSDPVREMHETHAKAAGLLNGAIRADGAVHAGAPAIAAALRGRNAIASQFWFADSASRSIGAAPMAQASVLLIDAADNFTAMLASMLRSLGFALTIVGFDEAADFDDYDLVVLGPGPGDPGARHDRRIAAMRQRAEDIVAADRPFLAVCLSHQIVSAALGLGIDRLPRPNQGVSRLISLFGAPVRAGFYNTYVARSSVDTFDSVLGRVEVSRDPATGEVYALRGDRFASMQFHAESVLSQDGPAVLTATIGSLIGKTAQADRVRALAGSPVGVRG
ncbi:anthranilate synthase family protein [Antrihabitans cavernicola]|uniref:anthranilate synthase n=1 Tax=Antrihabitans cavernicola TaxID=2495913 RepID=A0A5A7S6V4_9NOCA|nr:anthranilate synthase family protein [Spelaeibacter cavernicola]KAA0020130.1 phenazine-specific anthranilate synthase component I [Spelaeibacter cavernicola]